MIQPDAWPAAATGLSGGVATARQGGNEIFLHFVPSGFGSLANYFTLSLSLSLIGAPPINYLII